MVLNMLLFLFVGYNSLLHRPLSLDGVNFVKIESDNVDVVVQNRDSSHSYMDLIEENCEKNVLAKYEINSSRNNDTLYIKIKRKEHRYFNNDIRNLRCILKLVINILPVDKVSIEVASGDITVKDYAVKSLFIKSASGDVSFYDSRIKNASVQTASGDVTLDKIENTKKINIKTASGDVKIDNTDAIELVINTSSGDVNLGFISLKALNKIMVMTSSGDILLRVPKTATRVCASTSTGDIYAPDFFHIEKDRKDCNIMLETTTGDINVKVSN